MFKKKENSIDEQSLDKLYQRIDDRLNSFLLQLNVTQTENSSEPKEQQPEEECPVDIDKEKETQCEPDKKEEDKQAEVLVEDSDILPKFEKILVDKLSDLSNGVKKISLVEEILVDFKSSVFEKLIENDKIEDLLIDRNAIIQSYQEDVYKKLTAPLIKQFIFLSDMMARVTQEDRAEKDDSYWEAQFKEVINSILFILRDFSVINYTEAVEGELFNPNRQEVISTKETTDEMLDKKISRSLLPGFIWELPYILRPKVNGEKHLQTAYEFILRKEQIETYKHVK